jgi:sensor histidine kinase regulating citrate/malate metabolism
LGPRLVMRAVTPMRNAAGVIVGTVAVGFTVDNAYVDGLKQTTGLASAMYSGPVRVATTLLAPDGSSRALGVKETQADITTTVLQHNNTWSGIVKTGGQTYLAVYAPLRDADNAPVGMLFIGQPQVMLLQAAGRSIELTFLIAVLLLVIAIGPVHLIARFLTRQLH